MIMKSYINMIFFYETFKVVLKGYNDDKKFSSESH